MVDFLPSKQTVWVRIPLFVLSKYTVHFIKGDMTEWLKVPNC